MSLLDKITSPVPPELAVKPSVESVPGETMKETVVEGSVQPVLPGSDSTVKFAPISENDLPPLENVIPSVEATPASEPPISESDDISGNPPISPSGTGRGESGQTVKSNAENGEASQAEEPRKPGRPKGSRGNPKPPNILEAGADPDAIVKGTAALTFNLVTGTLSTVLGPEWLPRDNKERDFVTDAIAEYYRQAGVVELSPKTALCLVALSYSLPRISQPNTRQKLGLSFLWFKDKCAWAWGKLFKRK